MGIEFSPKESPAERLGEARGTIGDAVEAMRSNRARVRRACWGLEAFLVFQAGYPNGIAINKNTSEATGIAEGVVCGFQPYLMLQAVRGFVPWTCTQEDLLATDWELAE